MYIHRKADDYLERWKNQEKRKPLIIRGCRQENRNDSSFCHLTL